MKDINFTTHNNKNAISGNLDIYLKRANEYE